jgi:diguanylate cyclase (GGDEF)-like protein/PAS domain S-box-containing protein
MRRDRKPWGYIGLRGRYTLYAATLTTMLVLALTALSYFNARTLVRSVTERQLQQIAVTVAGNIGRNISIASRDLASLADQPLLANALLDSEGREAYLRPFIARHALPVEMDYNLLLVDYRGEPLLARRTPRSFVGHPWVESAIDHGESYAGIVHQDGDSYLLIAVPILYRFTGTHEGVLVFESRLAGWLEGPGSASQQPVAGVARVELRSADTVLAARTGEVVTELVSATAPVDVALPQQLALSVRVAMDEAVFQRPLKRLLDEHLWWGMLAVLLVAVASALLARAQTRRIEDLAGEARAIALTGNPRAELSPGRFGSDEIGDLANSLVKLLGDLKSHGNEQEALVAQRTADLAAREADLRRAQRIARFGSWVFHPDSNRFELSAETSRICGMPEGQPLFFGDLLRRVYPQDREAVRRAWAKVFDGGEYDLEHRLVVAGAIRWVHAQAEPNFGTDGRLLRCVGTVQDITTRRHTEARMREALAVFEASAQGIMTTDREGVIISANPAFCRITGFPADEVVGRKPSILRSGRHDKAFYHDMWASLLADGQWEGEVWNRRKNGEIYPQWLTISTVRDDAGGVAEFVALFSDISERKEHENVIWRQANFDALTGLGNRSLLYDRLEHALLQAQRTNLRVGLLFLDLDGFKWVNDTLGHDVGDELLIEVARRLSGCVREQDTVARLGGDEFTAVVSGLRDADVLQSIGDKILNALCEPFALVGGLHHISGSVGITVYPDDGTDAQTLLRNADIAMYKSKQAGKNRLHFFAPQMQADVVMQRRTEAELREAIAQDAFVLEYQPIVDADSGQLMGAEALIRWEHPERGRLPPGEFIAVAEECGLIIPIGEWALRAAARQWAAWQTGLAAEHLQLAVNISGIQFRDADLSALLTEVLAEHGIKRGALMLEIGESVLIDGSDQAQARMRAIKEQGITYALDDFGTGFSSLSYLKRFPVDVVKIDRSFVRDCPGDRNNAHLVEAIINMAHSLGLKVIAEGVETEVQMNFLRELGCDQLQGFLIGRPMPAARFAELIERDVLVLPAEAAGLAEVRLLSALRQDDLDVDDWLRRLLGENAPELADYAAEKGWVVGGLDLEQVIRSHLDWRRRLNDYISGRERIGPLEADQAASPIACELGKWIGGHPAGGRDCLVRLDRVHREFHHIAGQIVADYDLGYTDSARQLLSGLKFRTASRDVVVALIECYREVARAEVELPEA